LEETEAIERALRCDVRTGDRSAARAAVCLQDVAVEIDGALAKRLEVDHAAQRPTDQPLDLNGAAALLAALPLRDRCARRSTPAAASTPPSSSRDPTAAASAARRPAPMPCKGIRVFPCDQRTTPCGCSRKFASATTGLS